MRIVITEQPELVIADRVAAAVRDGARTIGLATGSSPLKAYGELIRRHRDEGLSFAGVSAVLLDEYIGLPPDHSQSFARFIREHLTDGLDLAAVYAPDGMAADLPAAARAYDELIARFGPVSVQVLGIGANGHLGFNEPGSSFTSRSRVVQLARRTREDNARFFGSVDQVPSSAITQGLGTICEAQEPVLIATGEAKAEAVAAAVEGPVGVGCPASVLRRHPHATIAVDEAAAGLLHHRERYRLPDT